MQIYNLKTNTTMFAILKPIKLFLLLLITGLILTACNNNASNNTTENNPSKPQTQTSADSIIENNPQLKLLNNQLLKDTVNSELWYMRGTFYLQANYPNKAIPDFLNALKFDSLKYPTYLALSEAYFNVKQPTKSMQILEKGVKNLPSNANLYTELGKINYLKQNYEPAKLNLEKAIALDKKNQEALFWLGMLNKDINNNQKAIESFKQAIEINPNFYDAYIMLALQLSRNKDKSCITYFDKAAQLDTLSTEALYGKAMYYQENNNPSQAIAVYKQLINRNPQYENAYYNIGYLQIAENKWDLAYKNFDIAIKISPAYANAYYMRGLCAEKLNNIDQALKDYDQAAYFDPNLTAATEALNKLKTAQPR